MSACSCGSQCVRVVDPAGAGRCRPTPGSRGTALLSLSEFVKHELPLGILATERPKIWPLHSESLTKGCGGDRCHTSGSWGHGLGVLWKSHVTHDMGEARDS